MEICEIYARVTVIYNVHLFKRQVRTLLTTLVYAGNKWQNLWRGCPNSNTMWPISYPARHGHTHRWTKIDSTKVCDISCLAELFITSLLRSSYAWSVLNHWRFNFRHRREVHDIYIKQCGVCIVWHDLNESWSAERWINPKAM